MRTKRVAITVVAALVVAAFWPWLGNPLGFVHLRDSVRTSIPVALIFGGPCATYKKDKNGSIEYIEYDVTPACYRFESPRVFKGIWIYEFEGSQFLENATKMPAKRPDVRATAWLQYDPERIDPNIKYDHDPRKNCYPIHAFEISFIGRRNPQGHGHMGLFASEIWPQRILSAKALPSPDCEKY
jgi:hypothetical protein